MTGDGDNTESSRLADAGWKCGILRMQWPRGGGPAEDREHPPRATGRPTVPDPAGAPAPGDALARWLAARWTHDRPEWTDGSWWDAEVRGEVRDLLWLPAGPLLVGALAELPPARPCPVDHGSTRVGDRVLEIGGSPGWPCACQVIVAAAWEACEAWLAASAATSLVAAAGRTTVELDLAGGGRQIRDPACDELAAALRTSARAMGNRVGAARALLDHPTLVELVSSATISSWAAKLVCDHLVGLDPAQAAEVVAEVDQRVRSRLRSGRRAYNSAEVSRLARAARLRICPRTEDHERVRAYAGRRVTVRPMPDGMACLTADLAETDAHRIHRRLTAIAAGLPSPSDSRTRDQMRADILVDLLLAAPAMAAPAAAPSNGAPATAPQAGAPAPQAGAPASPDSPAPPPHGAPAPRTAPGPEGPGSLPPHPVAGPEISVVVSLPTLLGLAAEPAEVPGLGPIPPDVARALAADAPWRAWVADAAGAVTAVGTRRYVPGPALARLVRAREQHCRFPGCRQPATRCDLDHTVPWPAGETTPANLGPLCRRHHNFKTHAGWRLDMADNDPPSHGGETSSAPSGWRWHTPAGLTIIDAPDRLPFEVHCEPGDVPRPQQADDLAAP